MASPFAPPELDVRGIYQFGDTVGGALESRKTKANLQDAWAASQKDGVTDYKMLVSELLRRGDTKSAAVAAKMFDDIEGANNRFGLQPVFDAEGNAYQLGTGGTVNPVQLPGGGTIQQPVQWVQTPQGAYPVYRFGGRAPGSVGAPGGAPAPGGVPGGAPSGPQAFPEQSGVIEEEAQPGGVGMIPKDYETPEVQKQTGDVRGKAQSALPSVESMTKRVVAAIETVKKSPHLKNIVGPLQGRLPTLGEKNADLEAYIDQAIGGTFTQVYESLRGAQAITDVEGTKATAAITRLQTMTGSEPGYQQALSDAQYETFDLMNTVRKKAGAAPLPNPYPAPRNQPALEGRPAAAPESDDGWTDLGGGIRARERR